jgi:hypothetical protein
VRRPSSGKEAYSPDVSGRDRRALKSEAMALPSGVELFDGAS